VDLGSRLAARGLVGELYVVVSGAITPLLGARRRLDVVARFFVERMPAEPAGL
jgi:hypothetical protein